MVDAFVLLMLKISLMNHETVKIGTFEHYGQCLQAEAAMSEAIEADERHTETRTFYRCFPVGEEKEQ